MYNTYIIQLASNLFANRLKQRGDVTLLTADEMQRQADACIAIARTFFERVQATLPPEPYIELLGDENS